MKIYLLRLRNANTGNPVNIAHINREELEKFKADAEKDLRYYTSQIEEYEGESVRVDNTVYAINVYNNIGLRETVDVTKTLLTYDECLKRFYFGN